MWDAIALSSNQPHSLFYATQGVYHKMPETEKPKPPAAHLITTQDTLVKGFLAVCRLVLIVDNVHVCVTDFPPDTIQIMKKADCTYAAVCAKNEQEGTHPLGALKAVFKAATDKYNFTTPTDTRMASLAFGVYYALARYYRQIDPTFPINRPVSCLELSAILFRVLHGMKAQHKKDTDEIVIGRVCNLFIAQDSSDKSVCACCAPDVISKAAEAAEMEDATNDVITRINGLFDFVFFSICLPPLIFVVYTTAIQNNEEEEEEDEDSNDAEFKKEWENLGGVCFFHWFVHYFFPLIMSCRHQMP